MILLTLLQALSLTSAFPTENEDSQQLSREKRQRRQDASLNAQANCNFGAGLSVGSCGWENLENVTGLRWRPSKGDDAFWIGGPRHDHDDHSSLEGGYVFLETSSLSEGDSSQSRESALIESPLLTSTGSKGHCVTFWYAIS